MKNSADAQIGSYASVADIFRRYWRAYGGFRAVVMSPYFHCSLVLTLLCFYFWRQPLWWEVPLGVLPNMVGFSLGGYAILLSFGDDKFRSLMAKASVGTTNAFVEFSASFAHFIFMELLALMYAFMCKGLYVPPPKIMLAALDGLGISLSGFIFWTQRIGWAVGVFLFIYALACALAATMWIFRISTIFATYMHATAPTIVRQPDPAPTTHVSSATN